MTDKYQIKYINKSDKSNPYEVITHIGGTHKDGKKWQMTYDGAIIALFGGKCDFYVKKGRNVFDVIVGTSPYGHKYLKTEADKEHPETLLTLPAGR
jgi:hypothetical protein